MRHIWMGCVGLTLGLTGCLSEKGFAEEFVPRYCAIWDGCITDGRFCPVTVEDYEKVNCDFDRSAAKECLEAEYTCVDDVEGVEFVEIPTACIANRICTNFDGS